MSLAQANNYLAVNLHHILAEDKGNVFFSPFSISTVMAMLFCAADGQTASEIKAALGYDYAGVKKDDVAPAFKKLMSDLAKDQESYTLSYANAMLSQKGFEVKDGYKQILAEYFNALVLEVDFVAKNKETIQRINDWVKEKTKNMIPKLVESLDPATVIVLLNAVYFKGTWLEKFNNKSTYLQNFYNGGSEDGGKKVNMMHMTKSFPFYEDEIMQVLQLPYVGEEICMIVLLPRAKNGLQALESNLTASFIQDLQKKMRKKKVVITLPRFRLEYTKSLVPSFQRLGITKAFNRGAELSIASDSNQLSVSKILHKAVLEVNEEGSEAAAATIVEVMLYSMSFDPEFTADHPFAFVIFNTKSNLILFMGRVNEL